MVVLSFMGHTPRTVPVHRPASLAAARSRSPAVESSPQFHVPSGVVNLNLSIEDARTQEKIFFWWPVANPVWSTEGAHLSRHGVSAPMTPSTGFAEVLADLLAGHDL